MDGKMKKYCKDCKWWKSNGLLFNPTYSCRCLVSKKTTKSKNQVTGETHKNTYMNWLSANIPVHEYYNKTNDCKYYKKRWWFF